MTDLHGRSLASTGAGLAVRAAPLACGRGGAARALAVYPRVGPVGAPEEPLDCRLLLGQPVLLTAL